MAEPNRQKAELLIEGGSPIQCWLNPKEIAVSKTNNWKTDAKAGQSNPTPQFGGGGLKTMNLDLLFDEKIGDGKKVKEVCESLFQAMEATIENPAATPPAGGGGTGTGTQAPAGGGGQNKTTKRPPQITFSWGGLMTPFAANCKQLSVKYLLFNSSGEPTRAQATLQLEQATPSSASGQGQNPTTRGMAGLGAHQVRDGDSLPSLAYAYYGDATQWRPIAEANELDDPRRLRRGQSLFIPRID